MAETVKVTIPELLRAGDHPTAGRQRRVQCGGPDGGRKNHVFDYTFVDNENLGSITRLEGFLFPDTYEFFHKEDAVSALDRLLSNFQTRISGDLLTDIENSRYSLREIVTLASIIEKEPSVTTRSGPTSPPCSITASAATTPRSVLPSSPMPPSTMPCTSPAWTIPSSPRIWTSPYNTYKHRRPPRGPICNPSLSSIKAAVHPNDTRLLLLCLRQGWSQPLLPYL